MVLCLTIVPSTLVAAQALQGAGGGLQQQAAPDQQTAGAQNQTGTLQNNNGSSALNQSGVRPLGVVSSPEQVVPEAVATPAGTLKTDITQNTKENNKLPIYLAVAAFSIALIGLYFLLLKPPSQKITQEEVMKSSAVTKQPIKPEPLPVKKARKTKKQRSKKKSKKK